MQPAQLDFLTELVPQAPSPWELMAKGLRETNEPLGERVEYLREQVAKSKQRKAQAPAPNNLGASASHQL